MEISSWMLPYCNKRLHFFIQFCLFSWWVDYNLSLFLALYFETWSFSCHDILDCTNVVHFLIFYKLSYRKLWFVWVWWVVKFFVCCVPPPNNIITYPMTNRLDSRVPLVFCKLSQCRSVYIVQSSAMLYLLFLNMYTS